VGQRLWQGRRKREPLTGQLLEFKRVRPHRRQPQISLRKDEKAREDSGGWQALWRRARKCTVFRANVPYFEEIVEKQDP